MLCRRRSDRRGALTVEFALTFSLVMLFFWGAFECARANILLHSMASASYEAARVAIVPGATSGEARAAAQNVLNVIGARDAEILVTPDPLPLTAEQVSVRITLPMNSNGYVAPLFFRDKVLDKTTTLSREKL